MGIPNFSQFYHFTFASLSKYITKYFLPVSSSFSKYFMGLPKFSQFYLFTLLPASQYFSKGFLPVSSQFPQSHSMHTSLATSVSLTNISSIPKCFSQSVPISSNRTKQITIFTLPSDLVSPSLFNGLIFPNILENLDFCPFSNYLP